MARRDLAGTSDGRPPGGPQPECFAQAGRGSRGEDALFDGDQGDHRLRRCSADLDKREQVGDAPYEKDERDKEGFPRTGGVYYKKGKAIDPSLDRDGPP